MKTEQELELGQLIERARAAFDALSPADQALLSDDQRRSFVRGQTGRDPGAIEPSRLQGRGFTRHPTLKRTMSGKVVQR